MADVRPQAAGDTGTIAFGVIRAADGIFSLFFFDDQSRFSIAGEFQQVLRALCLDEQPVLVIGVKGHLAVVLLLLQDVVQPVVEVFGPFAAGTVHTGDTSRPVTLVLAADAVEACLRNDLAQPVQPEEIVVARLVPDAAELQLAVVAEGDAVPFLLAAFQHAQSPVGEPDLTDVVGCMDHVAHGVVLETVHVAVRLLKTDKVVGTVVGVAGGVAFHIDRLHEPAPAVVFPTAEQPVGELQQLKVVPVVEGERVDPSLSVGNGAQDSAVIGVFHRFPAERGAADDTVLFVIIP